MATTFNHNNEVFVKDGKLGVGQSSPTDDLHVDGTIRGTDIKVNTGSRYLRFSGTTLSLLSSNEGSVTSGATNVAVGRLGLGSTYSQIDIGGHSKTHQGYTAAIWANSSKTSAFRIYNTDSQNSFDVTNTGNVGIGVVSATEKLHVNGKIAIGNGNTKLTQGASNSLRIETLHGRIDIGPQNTGWAHFTTDRGQFYFGSRAEIAGEFVPYTHNAHKLGTSTKGWSAVYAENMYVNNRAVMTKYNGATTAGWDTITTNGVWRLTGATDNPFGSSHATGIVALQDNGNYGFQLFSKGSNVHDGLKYRYKNTAWSDWKTIATQEWIATQGFITSETDSQTLSMSNGTLSISNGNSVDLSNDLTTFNNPINVLGQYIYGDTTTPNIRLSNSGGAMLNYGSSTLNNGGSLVFSVGGAYRFRINSTGGGYVNGGNFGFGTTSPTYAVDITSPLGSLRVKDGTGDAVTYLTTSTYGTVTIGRNHGSNPKIQTSFVSGQSTLSFYQNNTLYTKISVAQSYFNGGNVGIGTTTPYHKLDIYSDTNMPLRIHRPNSALNTTEPVGIGFSHRGDANNSTTDTRAGIFSSYNGDLFLSVDQAGRVDDDPIADAALFIEGANSYVGIGTISPQKKLHVEGDVRISRTQSNSIGSGFLQLRGTDVANQWVFRLALNGSLNLDCNDGSSMHSRFTLLRDGKLGLGTSAPAAKLDVNGTILVNNEVQFVNSQMRVYRSSDDMKFRTGNVDRMTITSDGKVAINGSASTGTTDRLTVHGRIVGNHDGLYLDGTNYGDNSGLNVVLRNHNGRRVSQLLPTTGSGWGDLSLVSYGGKVGIGTLDPTEKLHITAGNIALENGYSLKMQNDSLNYRNVLYSSTTANDLYVGNDDWRRLYFNSSDGYRFYGTGTSVYFGQSTTGKTVYIYSTHTAGHYVAHQWNSGGYNITSSQVPIRIDGTNQVRIMISGSTKAYFNTTGLGLGGVNPSEQLHLSGGNIRVDSGSIYLSEANSSRKPVNIYHNSYKGAIELQRDGLRTVRISGAGENGHTFFNATNTNVGIGTSAPAQKLHVNGHVLLENNYEIRQKDASGTQRTILELDGSNNFNIGGSYAGPTRFMGGGSYTERMRIHSNGNVGIGTNNPIAKLQVGQSTTNGGSTTAMIGSNSSGIVNALSLVNTTGNSNGRGVRLSFHNHSGWSATGAIQTVQTSNTHSALVFMTYGGHLTERMRISSEGNVGIGVINPTSKLHVNGRAKFYDYSGAWATHPSYSNFQVDTLINNANSYGGSSIGSYIKLTASITGNTGFFSDFRSRAYAENTTGNTDWLVNFYAEYRNYTSTSSVALSHHAGLYVAPLGVGGEATAYNNYGVYLDVGANATNNYGVYQRGASVKNYFQGNVGIGTTSPAEMLHVGGNIRMDGSLIKFASSISALTLHNINGSWVGLNARGINIGDWYTSPSYGDIRIGDYHFDVIRTDNTNLFCVKNTGNVGIGTTSPTEKLHVEGGIKATGDYHSGSTRVISSGEWVGPAPQGKIPFTNTDGGTNTFITSVSFAGGEARFTMADGTTMVLGGAHMQ